ncbi:MAG: cytochrome c biogenesis protein CcsA [Acidobacteriota bacterium]
MYLPGTMLMWMVFILGLISTVAYGLSVQDPSRWRAIARQAYVLMTAGVVVASALLMYLILTHDYRLAYVYAYSDNSLPFNYLLSTFWGGQEGSFLLWALCGVLLGLPLLRFARAYESRVMIFYNLTVLSLVVLMLKQDPFRFHQGLTPGMVPMDGNGLNPLLQNPWMVIHPPVMFVGYASLAIPFTFALAALWMRRYDEWIKVSMPWVLLSVGTLGTAIMMGGYWAYETLGWGGYWGWDPVENASLVPWLVTVALTHGFLLQRGRKRFRRLNLVLAIAAYLLVVYATFLTRSGVLSDFSVHSFVDLGISGWLVFNIVFFLLLAVVMLAWRWREIPGAEGDEPFFSRTIFFVLGILMLILIALVVVFGTSAPLITRLWMANPAQVGPDFYNGLGYWLAIMLALVLGATPFLAWHRVRKDIGKRLGGIVAVSVVLVAVAAVFGARDVRAVLYLLVVFFCTTANAWALIEKIRAGAWRRSGGELTHIGLGLMLVGFLTTGAFDVEAKVRLIQGEPQEVLGSMMTFVGVDKPTPASRDAMVVEVQDGSGAAFVLRPLMWVNEKSNQLVANPDVRSTFLGDLYVAPVEYQPGDPTPPSGRLVLTKDQPMPFRDWILVFQGFDMDGQHAMGEAMDIGVVVEIRRPDEEPVIVTPHMLAAEDGMRHLPADIPGTGGTLHAIAMAVDAGRVQVELQGLGGGIGLERVVKIGESVTYQGMNITFDGFDLSEFDPEAGKMSFGAVFSVDRDGETIEVVPQYRNLEGGPTVDPALIPGTDGMSLTMGRVSAEDGSVELRLYDPYLSEKAGDPASLVVDVSSKPLISLVWIGTLLMIAGVTIAIFLRRKDVGTVEEG